MNGWVLACLATMAIALVAMAIAQIVLALAAARVARQTADTVQEFRRDLRPVLEKVGRIADDASKTTALVLVQAQRIDELMESTVRRLDETVTVVQDTIIGPVRHGAALMAGLRAAIEVLRGASARQRRRHARDEDDALFIG